MPSRKRPPRERGGLFLFHVRAPFGGRRSAGRLVHRPGTVTFYGEGRRIDGGGERGRPPTAFAVVDADWGAPMSRSPGTTRSRASVASVLVCDRARVPPPERTRPHHGVECTRRSECRRFCSRRARSGAALARREDPCSASRGERARAARAPIGGEGGRRLRKLGGRPSRARGSSVARRRRRRRRLGAAGACARGGEGVGERRGGVRPAAHGGRHLCRRPSHRRGSAREEPCAPHGLGRCHRATGRAL